MVVPAAAGRLPSMVMIGPSDPVRCALAASRMCWSPAPSTMCAPTRAAASSIRAAISVAFAWPPLSGSLSVRCRSPWCTAGGSSRTWPLWEGSRLPTRKCSTATSVPLACAITSAPSRSATTTTQAGRAAAAEAAAARCGSGPTRTEVSPMDWPSHCSCSTCPARRRPRGCRARAPARRRSRRSAPEPCRCRHRARRPGGPRHSRRPPRSTAPRPANWVRERRRSPPGRMRRFLAAARAAGDRAGCGRVAAAETRSSMPWVHLNRPTGRGGARGAHFPSG